MRIAVVSNGNFFSTRMLLPLFEEQEIAGAIMVRVPPGSGGATGTLWRLARRTGARYAAHKAASLAIPSALGLIERVPVFLDDVCKARGVPCESLASVNTPEAIDLLRAWEPDVLVSVSSPERFVADVLRVARVAAVNVHWSLLPAYAGIAPYFWVLRNGETRTGVTVHLMVPELDAGNILRQGVLEIAELDTTLGLQLRLMRAGAQELAAAVRELPGSLANSTPQDRSGRTYLSWMTPGDVRALRERGRRLARASDYGDVRRTLRAERSR